MAVHSLADANYADMGRELDAARDLGANTVRIDVFWATLEYAGKGQYTQWYLDRIDRFFEAAAARGLKTVLMMHSTPCWASSAPESLRAGCQPGWWASPLITYPPANPADYADMAAFLAARYSRDMVALEVWNEPNLAGFLASEDPERDYASLVRATYAPVKKAAPGVKVLAGALSQTDRPFLEGLYSAGMKGHYDALSVHPYSGYLSPTDLRGQGWGFLDGLRWIREAQTAAGDRTPLWVTEFGWNTSSVRDEAIWLDGVSESTQADYLADAAGRLGSGELSYVEGGLVYNLRNNGTDPANVADHFGLLRQDFSEKRSFAAVRNVFKGTTSAPPATVRPSAGAPALAPAALRPRSPRVERLSARPMSLARLRRTRLVPVRVSVSSTTSLKIRALAGRRSGRRRLAGRAAVVVRAGAPRTVKIKLTRRALAGLRRGSLVRVEARVATSGTEAPGRPRVMSLRLR